MSVIVWGWHAHHNVNAKIVVILNDFIPSIMMLLFYKLAITIHDIFTPHRAHLDLVFQLAQSNPNYLSKKRELKYGTNLISVEISGIISSSNKIKILSSIIC